MAATNYIYNGSTLNFANSNVTRLRSISAPSKVAKARVTSDSDSAETYEPGKPETDVTAEVVGTFNTAAGTKGALTITWKDGTITTLANVFLESNEPKGQLNGEITSTLKFANSTNAT